MGEGLKRAAKAAKATQLTAKEHREAHREAYIKARTPFVRELARQLVEDQAHKSILLQMGSEHGKEWARLRGTTPLHGYPTTKEAEATLAKWLGLDPLPEE